MSTASLPAVPRLDEGGCRALRERLRAVGYSPESLGDAEQIVRDLVFNAVREPVVCWRLALRNDPCARLLRLFMYDEGLPEAEAREALGDDTYAACVEAGLLGVDASVVRALFQLTPFHDLWVLGDVRWTHEDAAMGATVTTYQLSRWLPDAVEGSALDVGCGAGSLALLCARRGAKAVGTDLNPRAIELARLNARLNDVEAEFIPGSLYEPVAGRRFDLIIAQPPFVSKAPDVTAVKILYGGSFGDELALRFVAGAPAFLSPGGRALFSFESAHRAGDPLHARLRVAMGTHAVDVTLLHASTASVDHMAVMYAANELSDLGGAFVEAAKKRWDHFRALGIHDFMAVLAVLRAPPEGARATGALAAVRVGTTRNGSPEGLAAFLASLDAARLGDKALLAAPLSVSPGARWIEERASLDPEGDVTRSLRFPGSFLASKDISEAVFALLACIEESADIAEAVERYAEVCGTTGDQVRAQVLGFVREMLSAGTLTPRTT